MKTILVTTDFSKAAENAVNYAAEMAKQFKAKLVLFHVYHIPVAPAEMPAGLPIDVMEDDCMEGLKQIKVNLQKQFGNDLEVDYKCHYGFAVNEIQNFAQTIEADLLILGMEGAGYLQEKLIGSTTTALMSKSSFPALAIGKEIKFKSIKRIALACDYNEIKKEALAPLKEIVRLFKAHVYILSVVKEPAMVPTVSQAVAGIKLDHSLEDVDHSFHESINEDLVEGINQFVKDKNIDMVVMIPRKHALFYNLFHETNTKKLVFHTQVPVLAIHT